MRAARPSRWPKALALTLAAAVLFAGSASEATPRGSLKREADRLFQPYAGAGAPGAAVVVLDEGRPVFTAFYGHADIEHGVRVNPDTVFHVASLTKAFTAYAVARLESEGRLSRRDPVRRYVPELAPYADAITLDHLIHHTSGIRDHIGLTTLAGWRGDDTVDSADVFRILRRQQAGHFAPGSAYDYSNSNYFLLALIIERVTGKPYADYLKEVIFEPAGMRASYIKATPNQILPGLAKSYERGPDGRWRRSFLQFGYYGDTNLMTTVGDLGRWADFVMTTTLAGRPTHEFMGQRVPLTGGGENVYAWGFEAHEVAGARALRHGGSDAAYRAHMLLMPERRQAVLVASNSNVVSMSEVADVLAETLRGRRGDARKAAGKPGGSSVGLAQALRDFSGTYRLDSGLVFSLEEIESKPRIEAFGLGSYTPEFVAPNVFKVPSASSELRFLKKGSDVEVEVAMGGSVTRGRRVNAATARLPAGLRGHTFYCEELSAAFRADAKGPALRSALGDPIGLLPLDAESFMLKTWGSGVGSVADGGGSAPVLNLQTYRGGRFTCPARQP